MVASYLGKFEKIFLKMLEIFKYKTIQKSPAIQYVHTLYSTIFKRGNIDT